MVIENAVGHGFQAAFRHRILLEGYCVKMSLSRSYCYQVRGVSAQHLQPQDNTLHQKSD